jgi:hypothetical protein
MPVPVPCPWVRVPMVAACYRPIRMSEPRTRLAAALVAWCIVALACRAPQSEVAEPTPRAEVEPREETRVVHEVEETPTHEDGPRACRLDADCPADPQHADALPICEANGCTAWDRDRIWAWAGEVEPELAKLEPSPTIGDAAWIRDRVRLWVHSTKLIWKGRPRCVAIDFEMHEGALRGEVPETLGAPKGASGVWFYTLELSGSATLLGPHRTTRTRAGTSSEAIGGFSDVGGALRVTPRALAYTGRRFSVELACERMRIEQPACQPAVCERCSDIAVLREWTAPVGGREGAPPSIMMRTQGACNACEPDVLGPLLPRLRVAVEGRSFVEDGGGGPTFHRSRTDCLAAIKAGSSK